MSSDVLAHGVELIRGAYAELGRDPSRLGVRAVAPAVVDGASHVDLDRTLAPLPELEQAGTIVSLLGRFLRRSDDVASVLADVAAAVR